MRLKPSDVDWTKPTAIRLWQDKDEIWIEYHNGTQEPMPHYIQEIRADIRAPGGPKVIREYLDYTQVD